MNIGVFVEYGTEAYKTVRALKREFLKAGNALRWNEPELFRKGKAPDFDVVLVDPTLEQAGNIINEYADVPVVKIREGLAVAEVLKAAQEAPPKPPKAPPKNTGKKKPGRKAKAKGPAPGGIEGNDTPPATGDGDKEK